MTVLHIVPGTLDVANGMVAVANLLAEEQNNAEVVDLNYGLDRIDKQDVAEVWVHGMWLPKEWMACRKTLKSGKRLVRITHGSISPVYLKYQSLWKKRLVSPIERWLLRQAAKVVATCEVEAQWIRAYEPRVKQIEITDLKRFFKLQGTENRGQGTGKPVHLLYLGRRHPLKGVEYLEEAVRQISAVPCSQFPVPPQLKIISNAFGEEKEKVWEWCDVLVLPTLSDNFGLVIAEAIERGKRVITTDGAPAWSDGNVYGDRLIYLRGYREGTAADRVAMLKSAIENLICIR